MTDITDQGWRLIQTLSYEYNALRAEVVSRYAAQFHCSGIAALVLIPIILAFTNLGFTYLLLALALTDIVLWLVVLGWIDIDLARISRHLIALEEHINSLGGDAPILTWEAKHGIRGVFGRHFLRWLGK